MNSLFQPFLPFLLGFAFTASTPQAPAKSTGCECPPDCCAVVCHGACDCCGPSCCGSGSCCSR